MKWITRERPKIDRIACPWLIQNFVDQQAEFIRRVQYSVQSITTLITDLLDLGRIEAGFDTQKEPTHLALVVRYAVDGQTTDCAAGEALWYEGGRVECRLQIARRQCNERSLLRRFGPGDKLVRIRDTEMRAARTETTFSGQMTMDGGVGAGVW